jgi:phenylpropionate dioxygenase-like ring-hydroxylating dioxygenase large terminal subunit
MRAEDNDLLTRVGPGAPMGEFMRQYWLPVAHTHEFEAGGAPVRLRVLGENFLGFRSPDGTMGVVEHLCAHRCASLFYGRNEEGGIRCVYHGWKFAANGQCIEMPSEPPETDYKERVSIRSALVQEKYGAVWIYLGDKTNPPPLPSFEFDKAGEMTLMLLFRECNWLQALEGDIDTVHAGFLHGGFNKKDDFEPGSVDYYRHENRHPKYDAMETPWGTTYCAYRPAGPDNAYYRIGHFLAPFWTMAPSEPLGFIRTRAWIPIDDDHSMLVIFSQPMADWNPHRKDGTKIWGSTLNLNYLPNTSDWYGRWRIQENPRNDHLIDRDMQKTGNYTGLVGIPTQDQMITESMGPIEDRTKEHLGTSDKMIALTRRVMLRNIQAFRDGKIEAPGAADPSTHGNVRGGWVVTDKGVDWLDEFNARRETWSDGTADPLVGPKNRTAPEIVYTPL